MTIFGQEEIHAAVTQVIGAAGIPADHSKAFVLATTTSGLQGAYVERLRNGWSVEAVFKWNAFTDKTVTAGGALVWSGN